jgi:twinkle protein
MTDILEIKRGLARSAQAVAEMLLPKGRREGAEWRVGSIGGEAGQSLGVHLIGDKAGIWSDFNSGDSGDLLDLWCQVKALKLAEALQDASRWLGIARPEPFKEPRREYIRPPKPTCRKPVDRVLAYLTEDRNIPAEVLERYSVREKQDDIVFPFLLPGGEFVMAKARKAENGAKPKPMNADCEPILFGWQAVPDDAREIIITEGEIDALSWAAYGFPAMSVPFGGGGGAKQNWIESDYERMERFEKIYLSTDMDKPGDEAAEEISRRLGRHRCQRVRLPHKDANECLVSGVSREDMAKALRDASSLDPEGLRKASDFTDAVVSLFWPAHDEVRGYTLPYGKMDGKLIFRPAEVTLWSGASGSGKSQILSDCTPHWIKQGARICMASLEMKGAQSLRRMVKQASGIDRPTANYIPEILRWLDHGLLLYDYVGKRGVDSLLEVFSYARAKYGCDQFIIDSLMRLGIAGDDYTGQEKAVFHIVDWCIANNAHVHLVAHSRKGEKGQGAPETEDIKGAMEIGANAFNILTVWRNKRLEDDVQGAKTDEERAELEQRPGVVLNVAKQRNGDFEGKIGLWFDRDTYRYHSSHDRSIWPRRYMDDSTSLKRGEAA